jgi:hypothetical protein
MFSGAAGLIAGFAALSLPILVFQDAASSRIVRSSSIVVPALMLCLGFLASLLLRFSLMRDDPDAALRSHGLVSGMRSLRSQKRR